MTPAELFRRARAILEANPQVQASAEEVVGMLATCHTRVLQNGEIICREGEPSLEMWWILEGSVRVYREEAGTELGLVRAPQMLGQMGIIDRARRSATCAAAEDRTRLAAMDRATFRNLIRQTDGRGIALRRLLLSSLTHQLTESNAHLRRVVAAGGEAGRPERALQAFLSENRSSWSGVR